MPRRALPAAHPPAATPSHWVGGLARPVLSEGQMTLIADTSSLFARCLCSLALQPSLPGLPCRVPRLITSATETRLNRHRGHARGDWGLLLWCLRWATNSPGSAVGGRVHPPPVSRASPRSYRWGRCGLELARLASSEPRRRAGDAGLGAKAGHVVGRLVVCSAEDSCSKLAV